MRGKEAVGSARKQTDRQQADRQSVSLGHVHHYLSSRLMP